MLASISESGENDAETTRSVEGSTPTTESMAEPRSAANELPLDTVFDLLSNERRRRVVRYLLAESETTTLGDLAEHIASIENDKPEAALTSTERKRVYICLYQSHLPKMADAGVIDFEKDRKTVQRGERLADVTRFLPEEPEAGSAGRSSEMLTAVTTCIERVSARLLNARKPLGVS